MRGIEPAPVSDNIIDDIRSRERAGLIELPNRRLVPGARVPCRTLASAVRASKARRRMDSQPAMD